MREKENLSGNRFGKLTVIRRAEPKTKYKQIYYECKCDCGNTTVVRKSHLVSGETKSCGCSLSDRRIKLEGTRIGRLFVLEYLGNRKYRCLCDCGNETIVDGQKLRTGNTVSCGCYRKELQEGETFRKTLGMKNGTCCALISSKKARKDSVSGYRGVTRVKDKNKWRAQICFQGRHMQLGTFDTKEEAIVARKEGEETFFKPYLEKQKYKKKGILDD